MHLDVLDLKNFYYRSALGRVAQKAVRDQVVRLWPEAKGQTVAGFGFAVPLLRPYLADARRVIGLMPGPQGVMSWPAGMKNVALLCDETHWPLETGSVDKLVLMHGLETCETPATLLEECWRVLGPGGRMIVIVPNRAGLWARRDATPFGFGRPYSLGQLEAQLKAHSFEAERHVAALYALPSHRRFWLKTGPIWESTGRRFAGVLAGGVFMVEASKQMYRPRRSGIPETVRKPLRLLDGIAQPGVEPI
ncbi:Methyltransferase domain protein [Pseudoruegeria aquimaris]|uniref:Methyltransferase domain protein n=1 Tax=Pseudoruegeria aquimaris TaxID=393663 RepID=A0A1Y5T9P2_9RHOB|nr:methyltransferase domain-containing protein [Pseudoruegeria aquimaris]SLN57181.1 Methyltransferase domain protein [Pseudoruegeria aquimaris]